jgi:hypothetical protein
MKYPNDENAVIDFFIEDHVPMNWQLKVSLSDILS